MSMQLKRILNEIREIQTDKKKGKDEVLNLLELYPMENNYLECHFTILGPNTSEFENGIYHGKIVFPNDYPTKPPDVYFFTKNGRFETGTKICLNVTSFHTESWNCVCNLRIILLAIMGYFEEDAPGIGSIRFPKETRLRLAEESHHFSCGECGFCAKESKLLEVLEQRKKKKQEKPEKKVETNEKTEEIGKIETKQNENDVLTSPSSPIQSSEVAASPSKTTNQKPIKRTPKKPKESFLRPTDIFIILLIIGFFSAFFYVRSKR